MFSKQSKEQTMSSQYTFLKAASSTIDQTANKNAQPEFSGIFVLFVIFILFYLILIRPFYRSWKKLPTMAEYVRQNPNCKTNSGITCVNCGSRSIRNWGLTHSMDKRRCHICNHCGVKLYRSESISL